MNPFPAPIGECVFVGGKHDLHRKPYHAGPYNDHRRFELIGWKPLSPTSAFLGFVNFVSPLVWEHNRQLEDAAKGSESICNRLSVGAFVTDDSVVAGVEPWPRHQQYQWPTGFFKTLINFLEANADNTLMGSSRRGTYIELPIRTPIARADLHLDASGEGHSFHCLHARVELFLNKPWTNDNPNGYSFDPTGCAHKNGGILDPQWVIEQESRADELFHRPQAEIDQRNAQIRADFSTPVAELGKAFEAAKAEGNVVYANWEDVQACALSSRKMRAIARHTSLAQTFGYLGIPMTSKTKISRLLRYKFHYYKLNRLLERFAQKTLRLLVTP